MGLRPRSKTPLISQNPFISFIKWPTLLSTMSTLNNNVKKETNKDHKNYDKDNVWIIIAAYKEEKKIGEVIQRLKEQKYRNIVVVDDGSPDTTAHAAEQAGATVLTHVINRGQGAALKTGIDYAIKNDADFIVTFDADGQHQAEEISSLIIPIVNGECEAALGSRFLGKESNLPWHRRVVLKGGAFVIWFFSGIRLTDSHNGFRALTTHAASQLDLRSDRMEHASEIVEQIAKKRIMYKEIPVTIKYTDYSLEKGQSSFAAFGILWEMIKGKLLR
jgi:polyprenyl-phospho-N-acetylgalactosaminyl synthase